MTGPYAGLREINGVWDVDPSYLLPRIEHVAQLEGRAAVLERVGERYVLYTEEA